MSSSEALSEFTQISLCVRGMDVRVYESRVVDGPAFVLVHGFGVSSRYFGPLAAELSKYGRVLVLDLPGFGDTHDPDKSPRITGFAQVVNATIRRLEVEDAIIIGHSMGTQVAVEALERAPGLARAALLAAPVVNDRERKGWLLLWRFVQSAVKEPPSSAWDSVVGFSRTTPGWLWHNFFPMLRYRIEDHLRHTEAPIVIVGGSEDRIAPPDWCHRLATVRDGVDVVIVDGEAHEMIHTAPVAVTHAAMALAGHPLPPGLPPCGD
ncbi:MAG: alpha/beta hydrolase [Arachnia sp.]